MQSSIPNAKSNNGEEGPEDPVKILRKHISKQRRHVKKLSTTKVVDETISFSLPENFHVPRFKDLDKVMPKLKNWRTESRQCDTTMRDAENKSGQHVMSDMNEKVTSTCNGSQNIEEEKNNAEVGNNSMEKSQSLPTKEGFTLHDVGALLFEELQEIIESLGVDNDSKIHFIYCQAFL
ncbi:BspA-like protein [Sesbania bispinosa]|nr:BspA-like protein [Sesbania bispinosa]